MTKFIELKNDETQLPILVNVDMIVAIEPYDDDEDEEPKTFVYISGDDANSPLEIAESYEQVKAKIKSSGVISCSEIVKRRNGK